MRPIRIACAVLAVTLCMPAVTAGVGDTTRPNFLVITLEDLSASRLACYGDQLANTPAIDGLARDGVRFTQAIATAPVCAPSRCTLITGVEAVSLGGMHMRSHLKLPPAVKCFTHFLREAGYFCVNNGKTDYQFPPPSGSWDVEGGRAHWRARLRPEQPFYAVFNITLTHQGNVRDGGYAQSGGTLPASLKTDPAKVTVPAFLPDTPIVRRDIARVYDNLACADRAVAGLLEQLDADALADRTIVVLLSDHGDGGLPRCKEYPYDSGLRVPFIVRAPAGMKIPGLAAAGAIDDRLITFSDVPPTVLRLAGVAPPSYMRGHSFLGEGHAGPREFVVSTRDRGNDRYETLRSVTDDRWLYIRHFQPWRPLIQAMCGFEGDTSLQELNRVAAAGELPPAARQFMRPTQKVEELFDRVADPDNVHNLAGSPEHAGLLEAMRARLDEQIAAVGDLGFLPEDMLRRFVAAVGTERFVGMGVKGKYDALEASRWAALGQVDPLDPARLEAGLNAADPVARYWSAIAAATVGLEIEPDDPTALRLEKLLDDEFDDVRAAAAFALVRTGAGSEPALETFRSLLTGNRPYATLNALNLIDLLPKPFAGRLRRQIETLARLESRSSADAERYVRDLSRTMLKNLP